MSAKAIAPPSPDALLDPKEAADVLRVSSGTLSVWRSTKRYPLVYIKVGSKIFYRRSDLDAFIRSREVHPEIGGAR